jgi:hypothetical protein
VNCRGISKKGLQFRGCGKNWKSSASSVMTIRSKQ